MHSLPFLQPLEDEAYIQPNLPVSTLYTHNGVTEGESHVLYWPASQQPPSSIILFIPGNPGQVEFFKIFLARIHRQHADKLAIFAKAHMGHTPKHTPRSPNPLSLTLDVQVQNAIEFYDRLSDHFPSANILLIGHSIGSWIVLQIVKERPKHKAPVMLLCPTISNIASTPNGLSLAWLFPPAIARTVAYLSYLARMLPLPVFRLFLSQWPEDQLLVIRDFVCCPRAVLSVLTMARCEMQQVQKLDVPLLTANRDRIFVYYAGNDDWVGKEKECVIKALGASPKIFCDVGDTPHAFTAQHSLQVAEQCISWLRTIAL